MKGVGFINKTFGTFLHMVKIQAVQKYYIQQHEVSSPSRPQALRRDNYS